MTPEQRKALARREEQSERVAKLSDLEVIHESRTVERSIERTTKYTIEVKW